MENKEIMMTYNKGKIIRIFGQLQLKLRAFLSHCKWPITNFLLAF